jgi:hypothetical protein
LKNQSIIKNWRWSQVELWEHSLRWAGVTPAELAAAGLPA